jgi:hypothetical protein
MGLKPVRRAAESCALADLNFLAGLTGLSFGLQKLDADTGRIASSIMLPEN